MAKKPGKYQKLLAEKNYPRYRPVDEDDPKRADRIDAKKQELLKGNPENGVDPLPRHASALAERYADVRIYRDTLKRELYDVNVELDAITEIMTEQFEVEGITSISMTDGSTVRLQSEPHASIKDRAKVIAWAKNDPDLRDKVQETIHWQTVNGAVKALLANGEPEPEGIEVYHKTTPYLSRGEGDGE